MTIKSSRTSIIIVLLLIIINSCSNDFLTPKDITINVINDTIKWNNLTPDLPVNINIPTADGTKWRIVQFPSWMDVTPLTGKFTGGKSSFNMHQDKNQNLGILCGFSDRSLIFDIEGVGYVEYPMLYYYGGTVFIRFGKTEFPLGYMTYDMLEMTNTSGGNYLWKILKKPEWVTLSKDHDTLKYKESDQIQINIVRDNLPKGNYSGVIQFYGNTSENQITEIPISMTVAEPVISGVEQPIEGQVVDARFCKASGLIAIATTNPNKLYFKMPEKAIKTMPLKNTPVALSISESGDFVALTYTIPELSIINPATPSITKTINTDIVASDLELGNNGWAYLSGNYEEVYLNSINLETGQPTRCKVRTDGLSEIKKVPGRNLLLGVRKGWSPDGLLIFDITDGKAKDTINTYHLYTGGFWPSENGDIFFCAKGVIYEIPEFSLTKTWSSESPAKKGSFENGQHEISSIDYCAVSNKLFVNYQDPPGVKIAVYDATNYNKTKTFMASECHIPGTTYTKLPLKIPYLFLSKNGDTMHLIKKTTFWDKKTYKDIDYWFLETINLK